MEALTASTAAPLSPSPVALRLLSDERLARWAANGSQAAFAVIFERHHQALNRYCHSIIGNSHDAADALQNTMLKALRALPGETRTIALKPWLYRIAHNEATSLMRARRHHSDLEAATELGGPAAHTIAESRERLRDLTADLGELTEQQRGTLLMRELAGLGFDDISAALQITATAAKQSVYEARCALQSLEKGRAMDCDVVRRTLSDGDRRTLRNMKLRGHLRACAGCRDFEAALRHRPAHLAALTPPIPLAVGAAILQALLGTGGGSAAGHGGGGLLAGLAAGAKTSGLSLGAAKVASVVVIAGSAAGGSIYIVSDEPAQIADNPRVTQQGAPVVPRTVSPTVARDRGAHQPARRTAPETDDTTLAPERSAPTSANEPAAATAPQQPSAHSAPPPLSARQPSAPDSAGEAPAVQARPPAETAPAAPAPVAYTPAARPAVSAGPAAASAATSQTPAAPVIADPATARGAAAADVADAFVPPRPR